ncbi:hypothetical protein BDV95DRAFT_594450 [Massariosphaeria phaeospora]|uniref:Uncharacterized protein n=1 Tax=Massariosphaeria phaeospora TaxID=100035 RepID=A0A7C8M8T6_9PLEO|nr:hypothetical protein BDV95DRAFT_594450 [Massariosphaeria phaeospora]
MCIDDLERRRQQRQAGVNASEQGNPGKQSDSGELDEVYIYLKVPCEYHPSIMHSLRKREARANCQCPPITRMTLRELHQCMFHNSKDFVHWKKNSTPGIFSIDDDTLEYLALIYGPLLREVKNPRLHLDMCSKKGSTMRLVHQSKYIWLSNWGKSKIVRDISEEREAQDLDRLVSDTASPGSLLFDLDLGLEAQAGPSRPRPRPAGALPRGPNGSVFVEHFSDTDSSSVSSHGSEIQLLPARVATASRGFLPERNDAPALNAPPPTPGRRRFSCRNVWTLTAVLVILCALVIVGLWYGLRQSDVERSPQSQRRLPTPPKPISNEASRYPVVFVISLTLCFFLWFLYHAANYASSRVAWVRRLFDAVGGPYRRWWDGDGLVTWGLGSV